MTKSELKEEEFEKALEQATKKEAEEVAEKIRALDTWDPDLNLALCELAGLEEEYKTADEDFERIVEKAADILNVEIY